MKWEVKGVLNTLLPSSEGVTRGWQKHFPLGGQFHEGAVLCLSRNHNCWNRAATEQMTISCKMSFWLGTITLHEGDTGKVVEQWPVPGQALGASQGQPCLIFKTLLLGGSYHPSSTAGKTNSNGLGACAFSSATEQENHRLDFSLFDPATGCLSILRGLDGGVVFLL